MRQLEVVRSAPDVAGLRLAVAWQHPETRAISAAGLLAHDVAGYEFSYLRSALEVEGVEPLLGLPDLRARYRAPLLFPVFAERVMRPVRPDRAGFVRALGLPDDADAWMVLARSEGRRAGDGIRLFAEPFVALDGGTTAHFFVPGLRHVAGRCAQSAAELAGLQVGEALLLQPELHNVVNDRALLVSQQTGVPLGYVPDVLLDHVHAVRTQAHILTVVRVNGMEQPPAFRLLVRLEGSLPGAEQPFDGPTWRLSGS